MDITKITDVKELKSMAYDQMAVLEQAQQNLRLINGRIAELGNPKGEEKPKDK